MLRALGYPLVDAVRAVEGFAGTVRRLEQHGVERGVTVYDDYSHHPTEVRAALEAMRSIAGSGRIIAIQQPHTYSRTQHMYQEFADVLEEFADHTVMLDVYGAREDPVPGVTGELVSTAFRDPSHVHFVADWQQAADYTAAVARDGDFVVTLGCGNVTRSSRRSWIRCAGPTRRSDAPSPPLPSAPESPVEKGDASEARARHGRRSDRSGVRSEPDGSVPEPPAHDGFDAAGADEPEPTSTRDVWRAARARRKALRSEIRRFTQRSRRRRIIWLSSIGAVILLIGGSVAAAYSPLFAVEKITVVGAGSLDPAAIEAALGDQIGTPLALVDTSEVKAALLAFPLIETYALEARPPHDLTVRIVERTPVGVIRSGAGYTLVDAAGVALSTTSDQPRDSR